MHGMPGKSEYLDRAVSTNQRTICKWIHEYYGFTSGEEDLGILTSLFKGVISSHSYPNVDTEVIEWAYPEFQDLLTPEIIRSALEYGSHWMTRPDTYWKERIQNRMDYLAAASCYLSVTA